jgi:hypothetical protein
MGNTKARATVTLPRPITGSELVGAIRAVITAKAERDGSAKYAEEHLYRDANVYIVGQTSGYIASQLRVRPKDGKRYISLDGVYETLVVESCRWPEGGGYMSMVYDDDYIKAVLQFVEDLIAQFNES